MQRLRLLVIAFIVFNALLSNAQTIKKPKYIFYLIGDGMGISQVYLADKYCRDVKGDSLTMLSFPICGLSTTTAATRFITGSAAAGTALANGEKTSINTIGLSTDHSRKLKSIAYYAQESGKNVGIVTSVPINHATPAAFYAHQKTRHEYNEIAMELSQSGFQYFAGGAFSGSETSKAYEAAKKAGYKVDSSKSVLNDISKSRKFIIPGIKKEALEYVMDRSSNDFTLIDFTQYGINQLDSENGFFLMVEGGRIDWACHANDAAASIHETIEFDNVVKAAYDFYMNHKDETLIVITADHETGGLALGNNVTAYNSNIAFLQNQKVSMDKFSSILENEKNLTFDKAMALVKEYYGLGDSTKGLELTADEILKLKTSYNSQFNKGDVAEKALYTNAKGFAATTTEILVTKAGVAFASHNHTALPVPVFAIGVGARNFDGFIDNIDIAQKLIELVKK